MLTLLVKVIQGRKYRSIKNRSKSGLPADKPQEEVHYLKKNCYWTNKTGCKTIQDLIAKKSRIGNYYAHIYRQRHI